jgi:hypothetical protein
VVGLDLGVMWPVMVGLRLAEAWEEVEFDDMELMVGNWDSLADSMLETLGTYEMLVFELVATFEPLDDILGAVDILAIELVAGFDSLGDAFKVVMAGTRGLVAGLDSPVAGLDSSDDTLEMVMAGISGLVTEDTLGAVDMLTFELAGHLDDLEDISEVLGM